MVRTASCITVGCCVQGAGYTSHRACVWGWWNYVSCGQSWSVAISSTCQCTSSLQKIWVRMTRCIESR